MTDGDGSAAAAPATVGVDGRWVLAIDAGTSTTRGAVADLDPGDGWVRVSPACAEPTTGSAEMPSVVLSRPDGALLTGRAALTAGADDPAAAVMRARAHLAATTAETVRNPEVLSTWPRRTTAVDVATALIATILRAETGRRTGPPSALALLHPAAWSPPARDALREAGRLAMAALPSADPDTVTLLDGPRAAAYRLGGGGPVLVAELGGGGTELAIVDRDRGALVGDPVSVPVGAEALEDALASMVLDRSPDALATRIRIGGADGHAGSVGLDAHRAWFALRTAIRPATEALGTHGTVRVPLPGHGEFGPGVTLTHADLAKLLAPGLEEIAEAITRLVGRGSSAPDTIGAADRATPGLLVRGGLAELPHVRQWLAERTGLSLAHLTADGADEGAVAALGAVSGAAAWAAGRMGLGRR